MTTLDQSVSFSYPDSALLISNTLNPIHSHYITLLNMLEKYTYSYKDNRKEYFSHLFPIEGIITSKCHDTTVSLYLTSVQRPLELVLVHHDIPLYKQDEIVEMTNRVMDMNTYPLVLSKGGILSTSEMKSVGGMVIESMSSEEDVVQAGNQCFDQLRGREVTRKEVALSETLESSLLGIINDSDELLISTNSSEYEDRDNILKGLVSSLVFHSYNK